MEKIALFIDWDNLRKDINDLKKDKKKSRYYKINPYKAEDTYKILRNFIKQDESLYRIHVYTAPPMPYKEVDAAMHSNYQNLFDPQCCSDEELGIKYKKWYDYASQENEYNLCKRANCFLEDIAKKEYIALRKGRIKINGIDPSTGRPIFQQKTVDMLLGIDIAHITHNHAVNKILIYSNDEDMVPALKYARNHGLQTILYYFNERKDFVCKAIKPHIDEYRCGNLYDMCETVDRPF